MTHASALSTLLEKDGLLSGFRISLFTPSLCDLQHVEKVPRPLCTAAHPLLPDPATQEQAIKTCRRVGVRLILLPF